jgi:hypothetical protein
MSSKFGPIGVHEDVHMITNRGLFLSLLRP